jgi:hypothetical protein
MGDSIKLLSVIPVCELPEEMLKNIKSKAGSQWSYISKSQCLKLSDIGQGRVKTRATTSPY